MEYLEKSQVEELIKTVRKNNRHGYRDSTAILLAYRHGLRVSELINLQWRDINFNANKLYVRRLKDSEPSHHILYSDETRRLKKLRRDNPDSRYVFISNRGNPITDRQIGYIIKNAGKRLGLNIHPHILRHSCGYFLANQGYDTRFIQDYLGHKDIRMTEIYTKTNPERFAGIPW